MLEIDKPKKDMALLLEGLFGLFFILGAGWLYAGNKVRGGMLLAGTLLLSAPAMLSLIASTGGVGFFCCAIPTYLLMLTDILALRKWLENPKSESFSMLFKKGCLLYIIGMIVIFLSVIMLWGSLPALIDFLRFGFSK